MLLSLDLVSLNIYKHDGFSTTILDSVSAPDAAPLGVGWDGANVLSTGVIAADIYRHTGFSSSITECFSSPGANPYGLSWDGTNLLSSEGGTDYIYHSNIGRIV